MFSSKGLKISAIYAPLTQSISIRARLSGKDGKEYSVLPFFLVISSPALISLSFSLHSTLNSFPFFSGRPLLS